MRLGKEVGRVILNQAVKGLDGARWLLVSPYTREHMQQGEVPPAGMSGEPSLVVYDDIGAGVGDTIGFVEGREAAMPFPNRTPVDAIDVAIVDNVTHRPLP